MMANKTKHRLPMIFEYIDDYVRVTNPNTKFTFLIDVIDIGLLRGKHWSDNGFGYARARVDGKFPLLHRLIMDAPKDMEIDHINGDRADCRRSNLRVCTSAGNNRNSSMQYNNTSGYKGVLWIKKDRKWCSRIGVNGKQLHLGYFNDKTEAAKAYNDAAIKHHGEFAKLNNVDI